MEADALTPVEAPQPVRDRLKAVEDKLDRVLELCEATDTRSLAVHERERTAHTELDRRLSALEARHMLVPLAVAVLGIVLAAFAYDKAQSAEHMAKRALDGSRSEASIRPAPAAAGGLTFGDRGNATITVEP